MLDPANHTLFRKLFLTLQFYKNVSHQNSTASYKTAHIFFLISSAGELISALVSICGLHLHCSELLGTGVASLTHDRCRQVWDVLSLSASASQNVSRSSFCFPYGILSVVYFISKCFTPLLHLEFFCMIFILFLEMLRKMGSLNSLDGTLPSFFTFALCNWGDFLSPLHQLDMTREM